MSSNSYKPKSLPQLSAPFSFVAHHLNSMGVPYELAGVNVDSITPSQAFVDGSVVVSMMDRLAKGEELPAIWLCKDNNALDGHHRLASYQLKGNTHIPAVRILQDKKSAIGVLHEIQAEYDQENSSHFIKAISEDVDSMYIPEPKPQTQKQTLKAFKQSPMVQKSISGNFFSLEEKEGYKPYEIEFSALFDTDSIDKSIANDSNPVMALAKVWFPNLDVAKKAADMEMKLQDFVNTIVAEKARIKRIDGIKYGNKLLQSIDDKK
jgi:hypothetical protein